MAHDTRSSRKMKDDEDSKSKGRQISSKGSSTSGSGASDTSGLRRSARETSLKKNITLSPSITRKSERLDKKISETPPFKRKSERFEKKLTPTPPRISDRVKNHSSNSSGSKNSEKSSGSSLMKRKREQKEKNVKELTEATREVSKSVGSGCVKNKIRNAQAYKAFFMKQRKKLRAQGHSEEQSRQNKVSEGGGNDCRGTVDGLGKGVEAVESDSTVNKFSNETVEDNQGGGLSHSSPRPSCMEEASEFGNGDGLEICGQQTLASSYNAMTKEISDAPARVHVYCPGEEQLKMPELIGPTINGSIDDLHMSSKTGHCVTLSKRKRNMKDEGSDSSAVNGSKDVCTLIADAVSSLPSGSTTDAPVGTCGACLKRQRVENDPTKLEIYSCSTKLNQELCSTSATEVHPYRGELIADSATYVPEKLNGMQQKDFSVQFQTNGDQNTCLICSLGGKLLCCNGRGCRTSYHLSCLDPPMDDVSLGLWYCPMCVRKKLESGIYSVSEGIESIWDAREVEVSDVDGLQKREEFFVKYKGLAHIHNQWVPRSRVLLEAPTLVAMFNRNNQVTRWRKEWTVPHRLLQRRSLMSPKQRENYLGEHIGDNLFCQYEWLVKWHGLDYDDATWELENAASFDSPEGQGLIRDYERRRQRVKKSSETDKILESKKCLTVNLSELLAGDSSRFDNSCLENINKLRELWHKGENAVVVDDKERIAKVIAFIRSLQSDAYRPFLIISTPSTLCYWENEFSRLAPSMNVVVYSGNKDLRRSIRSIEFDEAGGIFQVLVTSPEAIIEDKNVFEHIRWETIIIDACHHPTISTQLVQMKMLHTRKWLLLVSGVLKESSAEYLCLLCLLDSESNSQTGDHFLSSCSDIIVKLKDRLSRYISHGCEPDSPRFREYWVPVQISTVQLEQYCENLLSNSTLVLSLAKNDRVGADITLSKKALYDATLAARKCCDHPYIVHPPLQALLTKDLQAVEYLDVGIKASGKLQLLDMMLKEIKNQNLRVLILFQSIGGSGKAFSLGDILDDFLRLRYGENSYERVECGVLRSKKDAAMNMFNNKEFGRFVFLLEARACLPNIKLSSVDTVIIFGSDWIPHNDIKALQKISLDSQFERIKVFRLYSTCTVEEKVLVCAKQGKILDSDIQNVSSSMLLWGAPYQLDKLDEFHGCNTPAPTRNILSEESLLKDVVQELFSILPQDGKNSGSCNYSTILRVQQTGGAYSTEVPLQSEMKNEYTGEGQPLSFWTKLLEGKHPQWKYCSGLSQRNRKRVQPFDELPKKQEIVKKRGKVVNSNDNAPYLKPGSEVKSIPGSKEDNVNNPEHNTLESEERRKLCDAQKSLHELLKPDILRLCGILQVSDAVKVMVELFLEYVMGNHRVNREPATILQAFQISLCWIAASFLKQKVDHKESLSLAKQHLNFNCKKEEAEYVYSMLRCLRRTFLHSIGAFKAAESPKLSNLSSKDVLKNSDAKASQSLTSNLQHIKSDVKDLPPSQEYFAQEDVSKSIKEIQKKLQKKMKKLIDKQSKDKIEVLRTYEEEKGRLERELKAETIVIRSCFQNNTSMRTDKLKMLEKKIEENNIQMDLRLEHLEVSQLEARSKLREMGKRWVEEVQSWARAELLDRSPSDTLDPWLECSRTSECQSSEDHEDLATLRVHDFDSIVHSVTGGVKAPSPTPESVPAEAVAHNAPIRTEEETPARPLGALDITSEAASSSGFMGKNKAESSSDVQESFVSVNPCAKAQITDGGIACSGVLDVSVNPCSSHSSQNVVSVRAPSPEEQNHVAKRTMPDKEIKSGVLETVSSNDGQGNLVSVDPLAEGQMLGKVTEHETVNSSHDLHDVSVSPPPSEVQTHELTVTVPDKEVHLGVLENVSSKDSLESRVSLNAPSSEEEIPEKSTEYEPVNSSHGLHNVLPVSPTSEEQIHEVTVHMPNKEVDLSVLQSVSSDDGQGNLASLVPPSSDEQICEKATEKETSEVDLIASDSAPGAYQQNGVDTVTNGSSDQEMPLVNSPGVHPVALVPGGSATLDQAYQDKGTLIETSDAEQEDAEASEQQNPCQQVENTAPETAPTVASNLSNRELPDIETVVQQPSYNTPDNSAPELSSAGGVEIRPSEDRTSNQISHASMHFVKNISDLSNQTVLRPVTSSTSEFEPSFSDTRATPVTSAFNSLPINAAPQGGSQAHLPSYTDPLQYELERLNKQTDHMLKSHEDAKLRLKGDCDKEIEEAVAEIQRKYELRSQEVEAEFLLKKKELDSIHHKVLMNKILAEAFRSKCMDLRPSGASGVQQDGNSSVVNSSFVQQLVQLSMHDIQRNSPVAGSSLASTPAANLQTSTAPLPNAPAPATNPLYIAPPQQTVPLSTSPIPSIPARLPHISSISPTGNSQGGGTIRAPAPHLQPFRPSTSMSNQQSHSHSPATSPSLPHIPRSPAPGQPSVLHNKAHQPKSPGDLSALRSLSALGLLMSMNSRSGASPTGSSPSLPNLVPNRDPSNLSNPPVTGSARVNPVNTGGPTDIVCLSDDD
ncbi:hypothetical protein D8674_040421 [Pyrus ussuriensis x Pyrus communis]|uniref:Helicase protein MOM1-like n=1 Tax=Pyrus ussuriensis x Pyrus communis TaxID=2448454 RepID=A0A5N5FM70_9ROSA|nr:hypothetical protein D8674_040421 [Pyrus ussuriensis x Pyrus communis]